MTRKIAFVTISIIMLAGLSSCATIHGWFGGTKDSKKSESAAKDTKSEPVAPDSRDQVEARLRAEARQYFQSELRRGNKTTPDMVHKRPYYFREWTEYPDGAEEFKIEIRENDSRTRPYLAEVKANKLRFSTQMHRERQRAEEDANFMRDTGKETLNYELRNGRWHRVGSLFVADKTEEQIDGKWTPRREDTKRVNPQESQPGWFSRVLSKITGRDAK